MDQISKVYSIIIYENQCRVKSLYIDYILDFIHMDNL